MRRFIDRLGDAQGQAGHGLFSFASFSFHVNANEESLPEKKSRLVEFVRVFHQMGWI
jgi:hypothetical protein